jgi:DNA-directed RNA polymerase sigma subunit (sigma70/sigma32)
MDMDTPMKNLEHDEQVMLQTYLEELPPLTRKQREWLGAWLCGRFTHYGEVRTQANLAQFRGLSRQRLDQIESKVLQKLRARFHANKPLQEELREIFKR